MTQDAINELIAKRVEEALKAYDIARNPEIEMEIVNEQQDDNVEANVNKGNGNGNRNGTPNVNNRGVVPVARYALTWFEKMETVFHISNCPPRIVGVNAAYDMAWKVLMKLMTKMVPEEKDQVEKYIGGLPDNIQGNIIAAEPTRL
ncbi:hypothetical protein Tco_0247722 [Tanacetum coccineum]